MIYINKSQKIKFLIRVYEHKTKEKPRTEKYKKKMYKRSQLSGDILKLHSNVSKFVAGQISGDILWYSGKK